MRANYLSYLNKLVDQYNNTVGKRPINDDYSALTVKNETNLKASKFKVNDGSEILSRRTYTGIIIQSWSYNPKPDSLIRDKVKEVLDVTNYSIKKKIIPCYKHRYI